MRSHKAEFFMHGDGPQTQTRKGAVPGKRLGLRACLILTLGAGMICAAALCAPASGAKSAGAQAKEAAPEILWAPKPALLATRKWRRASLQRASQLAETHGKTALPAKGCHGAGRAHVESAASSQNIQPGQSIRQGGGCHVPELPPSEHQNFDRSSHARAT